MKTYETLTMKMAFNLSAPRSWVASILPAFFGIFFCKLYNLNLSISQSILLVLACILMQSSVNTLNDYADFIKGNDSIKDNVEITDAVLIYNPINPKDVLILGIIYLVLGCLFGLIACFHSGLVPLVIGFIGTIIVILYSCGGPFTISYLPLGEIISGFIMGILIPLGITSVADGQLHLQVLIFALPFFLGIALIMMSNNGCDIEKDKKAKRYTFPVIIGRKQTRIIYRMLIILWIALIIGLSIIQFKVWGIIIIIPLILGYKPFKTLLESKLIPENRIKQMQTIVIANIIGNGSYLLIMLINILIR